MGGRLPSGSPSFRDPIGRKLPMTTQLTTAPRPLLEGEPELGHSQELTAKLTVAGPPVQRGRRRAAAERGMPRPRTGAGAWPDQPPGWGTIRMYGLGAFQPSGNLALAASSETEGTMITSPPCCQSAGVATWCFAVSCSESSARRISAKLRPVLIG